ncbi:MAG: hemerythrin domain-containing protein [Desulfobacteraceae bacterium]
MMPIGPLMIEHRLIERMITLMERELQSIEKENRVNDQFVEAATRFIKTYADRCHHGKEEDILFRELEKKPISENHRKILNELIGEHEWGRETTASLVDANHRYRNGDETALSEIRNCLQQLLSFYPKHIEKEDRHFFIPVMDYFSDSEKEAMLKEGYEFDSALIHQQYADMVSGWEE